jgi:hypothetical protein
MLWFGSSPGVAVLRQFPQAKSVGQWLRQGWAITVGYVVRTDNTDEALEPGDADVPQQFLVSKLLDAQVPDNRRAVAPFVLW